MDVPAASSALPYYDAADFTPKWKSVDHAIGAFSLTTQTGAALTERSLRGRIHVASFLFTRCAAVCPVMVRQLSRVLDAVKGMPDVTLVSYTVTPEDDTPVALARFGRERGIDPSRWLLVTGDRTQIIDLARRSYFADDNREDFLHTEKVLLVDRDLRLRGVYNGTLPFDMDHLIEDIHQLRH